MIRRLNLVQSIGLLSFLTRSSPNQARPRAHLFGASRYHQDLVPVALGWLPTVRPRPTWVLDRKGRIEALASLRPRSGPDVWELELLLSVLGERKGARSSWSNCQHPWANWVCASSSCESRQPAGSWMSPGGLASLAIR